MASLAAPAVLVQVGLMSMGVVDTVMAGRLSAATIAAVALGNLYLFILSVGGLGTLLALDPIVSQAVGAGDEPAIARSLQRGLILAVGISALLALALWPAEPALRLLRQPADVVPDAARFARASIAGVLPFFWFAVLRVSLQAIGRMRGIVIAVLIGNVANVFLNWVLMYGNLGAPRLGASGAAWSSSIGRWIMFGALLAAGWDELRPHLRPLRAEALDATALLRTARLGVPIGAQQLLEVGAFGAATVLMGLFGTVPLAGHEIALNLASLTFMVPLGVATAAAVLVGQSVGAGDLTAARWHAASAIVCGVLFMVTSASLFLLAPGFLARLYSADAAVVAVTSVLLPLAGIFQVFDGIQAVSGGVLRGAGDVRAPMLANLLGFWAIGIPTGVALAFVLDLGPAGLWWGLVAGLAAVALMLLLRVRVKLSRHVERLDVEGTTRELVTATSARAREEK